MPESTCLHIQDHESAPIRVVDIPWISVRIGRAAFCEVRLSSDDLADEACRLYRRGRSWHLVPGRGQATTTILLDGRPVDGSRPLPLPFDVPFRVGHFCLTLRQDRGADPDWSMYPGSARARPAWPAPAFDDAPAGRGHAVRTNPVVEAPTFIEAPFKPEWRQATAKEPARSAEIPSAAAAQDRWKARWQAAGAELKARAQRPAPERETGRAPIQPGFDSVPLKEPRAPRPDQPIGRPPMEQAARPIHHAPPAARVEPMPMPTPTRNDDDESSYELPSLDLAPEPIEREPIEREPDVEPAGRPVRSHRKRPGKPFLADDLDRPRLTSSRRRRSGDRKRESAPRARIEREPGPIEEERPAPEPEPDVRPAQWPSAREILASHRPRQVPQASGVQAAAPRLDAVLTHLREPAQWTLPVWLAGPPAVVFVMAVGLVGGILSWRWTTDAHAAAIMTGYLVSTDGKAPRRALPESVEPPDGTWSRSTAQHLANWAIFMSKTERGQPPSPREVAALLDRALQISPLNPTARLAVAQLEPPALGARISPRALGLSRDAISLSWCARRLLAVGDKDGALKIFQKALMVATPHEALTAAAPYFSDDPSVPRYLIPGEERVQEIVREIVTRDAWTFREWSAALPRYPAVYLAAARLLKKQGRSEAETLLDQVIDDRRLFEGYPTTNARVKAARAEALALKSRWRESEEQYRLAIDLIDDNTIKRSWWFNLADIDQRLDDQSQRQTALKAALADVSDDISRRATEIQGLPGGRPVPRSLGPKAN